MSESHKTITYGALALLLVLLVFVTAPRRVTPDAFLDRGESFFPDFIDPNTATTLEVIEFDGETGAARPFKVTFNDGQWTIPSHHNYPADGKDRLAQTAAGVIGIQKDDFRSNNVADHEACNLLDPLDQTITSLTGRGKRVTIRGSTGEVLADLIVGSQLEGRENLRFVRIPNQKRIYVTRMNIDISTKFEDWIERDLLQINQPDIEQITLKDYSINERTRSINQRDVLILSNKENTWRANRMSSSQEVDSSTMNPLLSTLDELSIVGVRPKPKGLSQSLIQTGDEIAISQIDLISLQSKGYFFSRDGSLLSNEGELEVKTRNGVLYTLRFGEIVYGTGAAVTAGADSTEDKESGPAENRYLFITTQFDSSRFPEPASPRNTDFQNKPEAEWTDTDRTNNDRKANHDTWLEQLNTGQQLSEELNARFADWYYVISAEDFNKVHLRRGDLIKRKES